jgi:hypothetical protein
VKSPVYDADECCWIRNHDKASIPGTLVVGQRGYNFRVPRSIESGFGTRKYFRPGDAVKSGRHKAQEGIIGL